MKNEQKSIKVEFSTIGQLTVVLLTTPINPEADPDSQVRLSNEEIALEVTKAFPERKANGAKACVAWYATKLKGDSAFRAKHGGKMPLPSRLGGVTRTLELPIKQD